MKTRKEEIRGRYLGLLRILVKYPELTTEEVAERMDVSLKAAWSDITKLEEMELVEKVRGGVKSKMEVKTVADHTSYDYRATLYKDEKRAIAQYVIKHGYVKSGTCIILDTGTTIECLFREILAQLTEGLLRDITIITNNVALPRILFPVRASSIRLILTGGELWKSGKCLTGRQAEECF